MTDTPRIQAVVLAGGDSERFGDGDKALADLDGRPLLAHVLDAVAAATDPVPILAVATDRQSERLARTLGLDANDLTVVTDAPSLDGPLSGLLAAARRSSSRWLLGCGCDMPLVTVDAVEALVGRVAADVDAVVPVVAGHDQPMLALYRRDRVLELATELGSQGPRGLLDRLDRVERVDAAGVESSLASAVTNVNTREELERVRRRVDDRR